jgi:hypothetical protein
VRRFLVDDFRIVALQVTKLFLMAVGRTCAFPRHIYLEV